VSKIFLIDNDVYLSRLYERTFRSAHHDVAAAQYPVLALEQLKDMEPLPDLIIMDVHMPNMTGRELFHALKEGERTKHIPVVVLTNSITPEDAQKFVDLGASIYMMKMEHHPKEIVQKVEEIIHKQHT
jgi:CheY-like chemotaxis protein